MQFHYFTEFLRKHFKNIPIIGSSSHTPWMMLVLINLSTALALPKKTLVEITYTPIDFSQKSLKFAEIEE